MRRHPRPLVAFACAIGLTLLVTACGGGPGPTLTNRPIPTSQSTAGSTAITLPARGSFIASAVVPSVQVYDAPGDRDASHTFANPWFVNNDSRYPVTTVFYADQQRDGWVHVLLPVRPNGTTGWVRSTDVRLAPSRFRIQVDLSDHHLTVYDDSNKTVFMEDTVAVGAPATPTPVGRFYLRVLLKAPDPTTVYGPYAYGLSSYSDALDTFNGGDAEIGIHGNNDTSVLGQDVSHGCIRMDNDKITRLAGIIPLGTPVEVKA